MPPTRREESQNAARTYRQRAALDPAGVHDRDTPQAAVHGVVQDSDRDLAATDRAGRG